MKKVLFVATVTRHIIGFHEPYLKWFKENGYEVSVASYGEENINYCDIHYNLEFVRSPFNAKNIKVYKKLKEIINQSEFDIIHCHTPMGGVLARIASIKSRKKNNTKVIYTAHGFHFYKGAPTLNWLLYYPVEKFLSRYTDTLITINEEDYNFALKEFKTEKIYLVNGVGVDPNKFKFNISEEEKDNLRKDIGVNKDDIVLIYLAEMNKNKNQIMAINLIKELIKENEKYKLLLVGKDSYDGKYQKIVEDNNLKNNIKFLGYREDIPKLMKIADIYISTSLREGLPINLVEAAVCGLPIIATNCRGNRDVVKKCRNAYIVEFNDINTMKEKVLQLNLESYNDITPFLLDNCLNDMCNIYSESEK